MWTKIIGVILFGGIMVLFLMDMSVLYYVRESNGQAIEQAIDAGIIKSGIATDAQQGKVELNESTLTAATREAFRAAQGLDAQLENAVQKNSSFKLHLTYDANGVPWIAVVFETHVSFALTGVEYTAKVYRNIPFESVYI